MKKYFIVLTLLFILLISPLSVKAETEAQKLESLQRLIISLQEVLNQLLANANNVPSKPEVSYENSGVNLTIGRQVTVVIKNDFGATDSKLNVRQTASVNGLLLGQQLNGSQGVITDGPIHTKPITWYKVDFNSGVDGWVAGEYLRGEGGYNIGEAVAPKPPVVNDIEHKITISEQVKCLFNGSNDKEKCYTAVSDASSDDSLSFYCSGVGTCSVNVKGLKGMSLPWSSSCTAGRLPLTTIIDGNDEYINLSCGVYATIDMYSHRAVPNLSFNISGETSAKSGSFTVVVIGPDYAGSKDWNIVGQFLKDGSSVVAVSNIAPVSNGYWSTQFGNIRTEGEYTILVYDSSYNLLTEGILMNTYKG